MTKCSPVSAVPASSMPIWVWGHAGHPHQRQGAGRRLPHRRHADHHRIAAHLKVGTHGSTYGGNPLACAVAEAVLDVVNTPEVLNGIKQREQLFRQGLETINAKYHCFSEVRGQGLLLGAVLNDDFKGRSRDFLLASVDQGLLALVAGTNVVRFTPSLVILEADIKEGLARFEKAVAQVVNA